MMQNSVDGHTAVSSVEGTTPFSGAQSDEDAGGTEGGPAIQMDISVPLMQSKHMEDTRANLNSKGMLERMKVTVTPPPPRPLQIRTQEAEGRITGAISGVGLPTPVKHLALAACLEGYEFTEKEFLVTGFREGFNLGSLASNLTGRPDNLQSARVLPHIVTEKLKKEISLGRIAGPFMHPPFEPFHVSPLGLVPKKKPNAYRMIHHLSYPEGNSVNDFIPAEYTSVRYSTIAEAIDDIIATEEPVYLAKIDVLDAFRLIPLHYSAYPLLGICWQGYFYYDKALPMGASSACSIFNRFSSALQWIAVKKLKISSVQKMLDDFLIITASREQCAKNLHKFMELCKILGVPLAPDKTVGPTQVLTFLGIELDTVKKEARLPRDKLTKCREQIEQILGKKSVYLRDLQSIIGLLNFCTSVVPGAAFLRRLIDLTIGITKPFHHIRLSRETKADLTTWLMFLERFNGKSMFHDKDWVSSDILELFTDSSGAIGYGATFGKAYFYGRWPETWLGLNITVLEFFPIVAALQVWGHLWENKRIIFWTDNLALVAVINKQSSREKQIMFLMRKLVLKCLQCNITFYAEHISSLQNGRADALSRDELGRFHRLHPEADHAPTILPEAVRPENLTGMLETF